MKTLFLTVRAEHTYSKAENMKLYFILKSTNHFLIQNLELKEFTLRM
ncbi:hypothetical protein AI2616V1_4068 [Serratia marcescens]|nr:hypothetical protein SMKC034_34450 [Serratia marcescens]BEN51433.1 hypothetical protein SMKC057_35450 [Serratia marcescens]CAE7336986.1 hypothetical protein AI2616V1_4068 [Serratia marcescens]CAH3796313.1 hypothetical protein AI2616V1_4068 [Serratia marcescens]